MQSSLTEKQRASLWPALVIGLLNIGGFFVLIALVAPQHLALASGGVFTIGLGFTAWTLGARHAFDADHIAAIDNATRKLKADGLDTRFVGFFFSLGHSTIVVVMGLLVALGVRGLAGPLSDDGSTLHLITGTWGPTVAGLFLLVLGAVNLVALTRIGRVFGAMSRHELTAEELDQRLDASLQSRGLMARIYGRATKSITRPSQMYPVGVMFGFGFDTATEIALLVLAGGAAASGLPFYAVLCLPVLFAAGMTLFDTLNSSAMNAAYGWSFARPARKVYYNFVVTGLTVVSALVIGALSLAGVLIERFALDGSVWDAIAAIDLEYIGFAMVAVFMLTWGVAAMVWRFGRIEERLAGQQTFR